MAGSSTRTEVADDLTFELGGLPPGLRYEVACVPELVVLTLLSRQPMYGYELVKAIQRESQDQLAFGEGCIYPILHYLEAEKLVRSRRRAVDGRSRHYYELTSRGQRRLQALSGEWQGVVAAVEMVMRSLTAPAAPERVAASFLL